LVCGPQRLARTWEAPGAGTCRRSWMGGCITGTSYAPPILTDSLPPPAMAPPALCVSMAHRTSDMSDSDDNDVDDVLVMDLVPTPAISSASSSLSVRLPPPPVPPPRLYISLFRRHYLSWWRCPLYFVSSSHTSTLGLRRLLHSTRRRLHTRPVLSPSVASLGHPLEPPMRRRWAMDSRSLKVLPPPVVSRWTLR
jgi:hypothetical protein